MVIALALAVLPALYLARYFYLSDKNPEPQHLIRNVFLWGIFSVIPAIILEALIGGFFPAFSAENGLLGAAFTAFIVAGGCEEWVKLQVVKRTVYTHPEFNEIVDGIVYTSVASLGFACIENVLYVSESYDITLAIMRGITSVPAHATMSGIMGYYIGKSKFASTETERNSLINTGFYTAVGIHGAYDFVIFAMPHLQLPTALLAFPIVWFSWRHLKTLISVAHKEDALRGISTGSPIPNAFGSQPPPAQSPFEKLPPSSF